MSRKIIVLGTSVLIAFNLLFPPCHVEAGNDLSYTDPFYRVNAKKHSWQDYYDTWKKYRPDDSDDKIIRSYVFHGGKDAAETQKPETPAATGVTPVNENPSATGVTPVSEPAAQVEKPSDFIYDPDMHITASDKPVEHFYYSEKFPDGSEKRIGYRYDAIKGTPNTAVTRYITIYYDNKNGNDHAELYRRWETYDIKTGKWVPTDASNEAFVKPSENKDVWASDIDAYKSIKDETIPSFDKLSEAEQKLCIINLGLSDEQCKELGFTVRVSDEEKQKYAVFADSVGDDNSAVDETPAENTTPAETLAPVAEEDGTHIFDEFNRISSSSENVGNTTSQETINAFQPK